MDALKMEYDICLKSNGFCVLCELSRKWGKPTVFSSNDILGVHNFNRRRLIRSLCEKRCHLRQDQSWLFPCVNAPVHNALGIQQLMSGKNIAVLEHVCSPNHALCYFVLFSKTRLSSREPVLKAWAPSERA